MFWSNLRVCFLLNGGISVKKLGIITISTAIILNIIGSNVIAKGTNGELSSFSKDEAKQWEHDYGKQEAVSPYSGYNSWEQPQNNMPNTDATTSYNQHNPWEYHANETPWPEVTSSYSGQNPWEQPEYKNSKPDEIHQYNPWGMPKYDIQKPEVTPHIEHNPWEAPNYDTQKPEVIPPGEYKPWEIPKQNAPMPEATPPIEHNPWEMPQYDTQKPEVTSPIEYKPWEMPKQNTPISEATPHIEYKPWVTSQYYTPVHQATPTPEVTPTPHIEYKPWEPPKYDASKFEAPPLYGGFNMWGQPYYNIYNPWAFYYNPNVLGLDKEFDAKKVVEEYQTNEVKTKEAEFDYSEKFYINKESNVGSELILVNLELEKARQNLSLIRSQAKNKIDIEIKKTRQKISSVVDNNNLDPKDRNSEIKKLRKALEIEVKSIKEDAAQQVKDTIEKQNTTIKDIFN
jgi:hypothetical protein